VIGTFAEDLKNFAAISKGAAKLLATAAAYLMPNFASLNVIAQTAHDQGIGSRLILFNTLYAMLYSASAVAAAVLIFERRNLK
jgi:ABC-type branched-subunit amino acid transport system substrate-binding protein